MSTSLPFARLILVNCFSCYLTQLINMTFFPPSWCQCTVHTPPLLKEWVRCFPVLCWSEKGICNQLTGLCGTKQLWGDGTDALAQPLKARCLLTASAAASCQLRGSACLCKCAANLRGSLLCFALLERAGAGHSLVFVWLHHLQSSNPINSSTTPVLFVWFWGFGCFDCLRFFC